MRQARLVPGDVLPPGVKVVLVAVGDHDPCEIREDGGIGHGVQAAGAHQKAEYSSVNAPCTYFFSPAGPERSVVSSNPATAAAVIRVRISRTTSAARPAACRRQMDEPVGYDSAGDIGGRLPAPLHRDVLEDDQVNGQGPQSGPDGQDGIRDARRPCRDMHPAAGAPGLVRVCCTRSAGADGISSC